MSLLIPMASKRRGRKVCLEFAQTCFDVAKVTGCGVSESMTWFWLFRWAGMPV